MAEKRSVTRSAVTVLPPAEHPHYHQDCDVTSHHRWTCSFFEMLRVITDGLALRDVQRSAVREGDVVGFVEVVEADVVLAEAELHHDERKEDLAMDARMRRGWRQLVQAQHFMAGT